MVGSLQFPKLSLFTNSISMAIGLCLREYISRAVPIRFEEYQLSRGRIRLSPTLHPSSDSTATLNRFDLFTSLVRG